MTPPFITGFYTALLALVIIALAVNVMRQRGKHRVSLGHADIPEVERAMRMHGNAVEYLPIALLLMAFYEMERGLPLVLHLSGIALILGRLFHVWGIAAPNSIGSGRSIGVGLTLLAMIVLIALLLIKSVQIFSIQ